MHSGLLLRQLSVRLWRWERIVVADPSITDLLQMEHPEIFARIEVG